MLTPSQRANPMSCRAMVTSPHYLATEAGLAILRKGGNALESAIAMASVLAVVYPHMCSLGGDAFWLMYSDRFLSSQPLGLKAVNASGRSGAKVSLDYCTSLNATAIPHRGYQACLTVPGMVSALETAFTTSCAMGGKLSWSELLEDALFYAEEGMVVSTSLACHSENYFSEHRKAPREVPLKKDLSSIFFPEGKPLRCGQLLRQKDLARSLSLLMEEGPRSFYEGTLSQRLVRDLRKHGNPLTADDFANYRASFVDPISVSYRDTIACNLPPNSQGMASLEILNILNNFDVQSLGHGSADYYHLLIEATKLAFIDRDRYLADPDFSDVPLITLLSKDYGRELAKDIDFKKAQNYADAIDLSGDTVWFGVLDAQGNAVSWIQSLCYDFGAAIVPKETGIILHNRASCFSLQPKHINCIAPMKRPFHTLNPALLLQKGRPLLIYGSMGGQGQPQTQTALVTRIVDFGMLPQEALDQPRWMYGQAFGKASSDIQMEARIAPAIREELAERGHSITEVSAYHDLMGHAGALLIRRNGQDSVCYGGSDPRSDGLALGF